MKVLVLAFGDNHCASSYYRIFQYQPSLQALGITLEAFPAHDFSQWQQVRDYDAVLVQKKLFATGRVEFLRKHSAKLIYDTDDATWHPHGRPHHFLTRWRTARRLKRIVQHANYCLAANEVLATTLRQWSPRVEVLPMALDGGRWRPKTSDLSAPLRIGWSGAPVNLPYLEAIEPALLKIQQANPQTEIIVFCGQRPGFKAELKYTFCPFQPGQEASVVSSFDIGLLPLPDTDFADGKSPIKGLQYLATGIPAVVSPRGATREMFRESETALFARTPDEWFQALQTLINSPEMRHQMGRQARLHFDANYALQHTAGRFADLLRST